MYPVMGNPHISPVSRGYLWVSYPQESLENTLNTMGTLLGELSLDFVSRKVLLGSIYGVSPRLEFLGL